VEGFMARKIVLIEVKREKKVIKKYSFLLSLSPSDADKTVPKRC
jgi:hypothetical protein